MIVAWYPITASASMVGAQAIGGGIAGVAGGVFITLLLVNLVIWILATILVFAVGMLIIAMLFALIAGAASS